MGLKIYPSYSDDLDTTQELPDPKLEAFCRAVARATSATDAFRTYVEPNCDVARARRASVYLWKKWWIQARTKYLEQRLAEVATVRAPLTRDDVLNTICDKFRAAAQMQAESHKEGADQARSLCQYGEMICKLTGAYMNKPGKHEVSIKVKRKADGGIADADA
ncbi:MAG: hypothetical protein IKW49_01740 [Opitutales bacterium]|nr:hypothetical protein [Opitutales bacterium]